MKRTTPAAMARRIQAFESRLDVLLADMDALSRDVNDAPEDAGASEYNDNRLDALANVKAGIPRAREAILRAQSSLGSARVGLRDDRSLAQVKADNKAAKEEELRGRCIARWGCAG